MKKLLTVLFVLISLIAKAQPSPTSSQVRFPAVWVQFRDTATARPSDTACIFYFNNNFWVRRNSSTFFQNLFDGSGTVTSIATNNGTGITGGTITTTGTLANDTTLLSTRLWRQKGIDSLVGVLGGYVRNTTGSVNNRLAIYDGATGKIIKNSKVNLLDYNESDANISELYTGTDTSGFGRQLDIYSGSGTTGGAITLRAGESTTGNAVNAEIYAGRTLGTNTDGGNVVLAPTGGLGTGISGGISLDFYKDSSGVSTIKRGIIKLDSISTNPSGNINVRTWQMPNASGTLALRGDTTGFGTKFIYNQTGINIYLQTAKIGVTDTIRTGDKFIGDSAIVVGNENVVESNRTVYSLNVLNPAVFGRLNRVFSRYNFAAGAGNYVDGFLGGAYGNTNIVSGNDSWADGNRNTVGRRMYSVDSIGVDDPGLGIGNRAYVWVSPTEGDITGFFPNATKDGDTDYIDSTYDVGYTITNGYVKNPSISDDFFRMPPYMIVRSATSETDVTLKKILKADYDPVNGTKIYYDTTANAYASISFVYGSYAPIVLTRGTFAGNGTHADGLLANASGYGAHAEGGYTRAWNGYAHSEGFDTKAYGLASHAQGFGTNADSYASSALGRWNVGGGNPNSWVATDPLFEIGNGSSASSRANAFQVLKNGNTTINGTLNVTGSTALATNSGQLVGIGGASNFGKLEVIGATNKRLFLGTNASASNSADIIGITDAGGLITLGLSGEDVRMYYGGSLTQGFRLTSSGKTLLGSTLPTDNNRYDLQVGINGISTTGGMRLNKDSVVTSSAGSVLPLGIDTATGNIVKLNNVSDTYTPTYTNVSGTSAASLTGFTYVRNGNFVTVYGNISLTTTSSSQNSFRITLPIASDLASGVDLIGTGTSFVGGAVSEAVAASADITNNEASISYYTAYTAGNIFITFRYKLL